MEESKQTSQNISENVANNQNITENVEKDIQIVSEKMVKPRIVEKDGTFNVKSGKSVLDPLKHTYTYFIDANPIIFHGIFIGGYFVTCLLFAFIYLVIALGHKDIISLDGAVDENNETPPCFSSVNDFNTAVAFSLETQATIGYGSRYPEDLCPDAILVVIIQNMFCTFVEVVFLSLVFTRIMGPSKADNSVFVSDHALITLRNGQLYLNFRVYDIKNHAYDRGATAVVFCVMDTVIEKDTEEAFSRCRDILEIPVGYTLDGQDPNIPLMWPTMVSHCINEDSPLYDMDPTQLKNSNIEIIVWLMGTHAENGVNINIRTSFSVSEIVWGARFLLNKTLTRRKYGNMLSFTHNDINAWEPDENTPKISAKQLEALKMWAFE